MKQLENGVWLASCPICTWKQEAQTEKEAEIELNNHISTKHREGRAPVKDEQPLIPDREMPPQIPSPIKER